jgi:PPP family 3-phenylpropionic acid transporter
MVRRDSETSKEQAQIKRLKFRFSLLQFTFWCSWCAFTSFVALYLKQEGLSQSQIGFALSVNTLSGIVGQLVWGFLCDRFGTIRRIFLSANVMIALVILSFLLFKGTTAKLLLMGLLGFAQIPQPSILDTWILKKLPNREKEYGSIRLWASIGFAFFALGFGTVINLLGFAALFIAPTVFILASLILAWTLEDIDCQTDGGTGSMRLKPAFKELVSNKGLLYFIAVCFTIGLAARTTHLLLPLIIEAVKGTSFHLGLALFITGVTEIPMLLLSKRLSKRFKPQSLVLISVLCYGVQFTLLFLANSLFLVFMAMAFQGLAFGNLLPSVRLFVYKETPEAVRTTAQTITDAIYSSLAGVIGSAAGGIIIQKSGLPTLIMVCLGLIAIAFLALCLKMISQNHR